VERGDKRPPLRPGMEILVQVTKEESTIKGAAVTSLHQHRRPLHGDDARDEAVRHLEKITGEKERERIRKQMEKLE